MNGNGTVLKLHRSASSLGSTSFVLNPIVRTAVTPVAGLYGPPTATSMAQPCGGTMVTPMAGTIFKITPAEHLRRCTASCGGADGGDPRAAMIQASNGDLYGTTYQGGANGAMARSSRSPRRATFTTLYSFCSQSACADGEFPVTSLVQASNGNLYGTTLGRTSNHGTIFKITPSGTLTTLYSFCSQTNCTDGSSPYARLMQATDGNLYGTPWLGGAHSVGTIFQITHELHMQPSRRYTASAPKPTLLRWHLTHQAELVQATNGDLYGTSNQGGAHTFGRSLGYRLVWDNIELEPGPPARWVDGDHLAGARASVSTASRRSSSYSASKSRPPFRQVRSADPCK